MYKRNLDILLSVVISVISSTVNFNAYLKGYMPTPFQFFLSIICILFWTSLSFYRGYKKDVRYLTFSSLFWGAGLFLFVLGYITDNLLIAIPSILVIAGPLYGLRYILKLPPDIFFVIMSVTITYVLILIGFFIGKISYSSKKDVK